MNQYRQSGFPHTPPVVKNLLIINVLVFIVQQLFEHRGIRIGGHSFEDIFALHYWRSANFQWWQLLTHQFMHGGFTHIAFNMFALWMFGRILEDVWGPQKFIIFYIICGVGAAICHLAVLTYEFAPFQQVLTQYQQHPNISDFFRIAHTYPVRYPEVEAFYNNWQLQPDSTGFAGKSIDILKTHWDEATVGASGAVFGLLFGFGYLFPNIEMYIYFIPVPIKAKWVVAGYCFIELTQGVAHSAGDNVAHFAHLGGALFAFLLLRFWGNKFRNRYY